MFLGTMRVTVYIEGISVITFRCLKEAGNGMVACA